MVMSLWFLERAATRVTLHAYYVKSPGNEICCAKGADALQTSAGFSREIAASSVSRNLFSCCRYSAHHECRHIWRHCHWDCSQCLAETGRCEHRLVVSCSHDPACHAGNEGDYRAGRLL